MLVKRPTINCTVWVQSVLGASIVQARENLLCCVAMSRKRSPKLMRQFAAHEARRTGASHYSQRACGDADKAEKERQSFAFNRWRGWWAYRLTAGTETSRGLALDSLRGGRRLRLLGRLGRSLLHGRNGLLLLAEHVGRILKVEELHRLSWNQLQGHAC